MLCSAWAGRRTFTQQQHFGKDTAPTAAQARLLLSSIFHRSNKVTPAAHTAYSSSMAPLAALQFDNTVLQELPVDESQKSGVRQVRGAIYSLVDPTPLRDPKLVAYSADALALLGLEVTEVGWAHTAAGSVPLVCVCGLNGGGLPVDESYKAHTE